MSKSKGLREQVGGGGPCVYESVCVSICEPRTYSVAPARIAHTVRHALLHLDFNHYSPLHFCFESETPTQRLQTHTRLLKLHLFTI